MYYFNTNPVTRITSFYQCPHTPFPLKPHLHLHLPHWEAHYKVTWFSALFSLCFGFIATPLSHQCNWSLDPCTFYLLMWGLTLSLSVKNKSLNSISRVLCLQDDPQSSILVIISYLWTAKTSPMARPHTCRGRDCVVNREAKVKGKEMPTTDWLPLVFLPGGRRNIHKIKLILTFLGVCGGGL